MSKNIPRQIARKLAALTHYKMSAGHYGHSYGYGGQGSGGEKWPGGLSGDGRGADFNHRRLRQNARRACADNLIARSIVDRYKETVADVGLKWESSPMSDILRISPEQAEKWASNAEQRFHLWARSKQSHRSETMNFYQAQGLYAASQQRDNDIFVRLYYSSNRELQNPLQFEFIDPEQIVGDSLSTSRGYFSQRDGITKDAAGKETGYKVRVKKDGKYKTITVPAKAGLGRTIMMHGFMQEYAGQTRGYSRLSHALQEFQNLTDFSSAQIMKAINQSQVWIFNKPSSDAPASNPLEDLTQIKAGPASHHYGSDPVAPAGAENVTEESLHPFSYHDPPEGFTSQPGSVGVWSLNRGEEIKPFVNTAPAESYDKFVDSFAAYLSASTGVPVEMMLMRFNSNYSASRAALILFWRIARIWQHEMAVDFLDIVIMSWLSEEIAAGRMTAPGWSDPILRAAWLNGTWHGIPLPNIDPVKTAKADVIDVHQLNAKDLDRVARERGGEGRRTRALLNRQFKEMAQSPLNKTTTNR